MAPSVSDPRPGQKSGRADRIGRAPAGPVPGRETDFPGVVGRSTLRRMDPQTRLSLLRALAALPLLAFLPLIALTLLAPLRLLARSRRDD